MSIPSFIRICPVVLGLKQIYLCGKIFQGSKCPNDFSWLDMVVHMSDIFTYENSLNLGIQGKGVTLFNN
jgi:hypothetical protein